MPENFDQDESSEDSEKTQIFSNQKPKPSPKPSVNKTKGAIPKTNPSKTTTTSVVGPYDKEGKYLANPDEKAQDKQPKDLLVEEKETKEPEVLFCIRWLNNDFSLF